MQLVELIRGLTTEEGTFQPAKAFVVRLRKIVTVSKDYPAFIVNPTVVSMH